MPDSEILLDVKGLKQYFGKEKKLIKAVDNVSFHINKGEIHGLVGESGSGKTTIGRSLIRIYNPTSGEVSFKGENIIGDLSKETKRELNKNMQMVFQDPVSSLNPSKRVFDIIAQGLDIHHLYSSKEERKDKVYKIMEEVGLLPEHALRYPRQFSGGQRQRIAIARALIMNPDFIIADEPISALDVSIQAQVVNLFKDIQKKHGTTILFVAHDLAMVKYISDRIGVMHLGKIVETGTTKEIFDNPVHPYTKALLSAQPRLNPRLRGKIKRTEFVYENSGIDYNAGTMQHLSGEHYVLATELEKKKWTSNR